MGSPATDLAARLGYRFKDHALLAQALTPPSSGLPRDNQRLAFLGNDLLKAAPALLIHREKPAWDEGDMSKLRGMLVCTRALEAWAKDIGLGLVPGPRSPKLAASPKTMADAMEALLAAVYEDSGPGGFQAVLDICEARFLATIQGARPGDWKRQDAKTALQERAAVLGFPAPHYNLVERSGPDHAPRFQVEATVGDLRASGLGTSRKAAEVEAARALMARIGE